MASLVTQEGQVVPPLNISAPAPIISLRGFKWTSVDDILNERPPQDHDLPQRPPGDPDAPAAPQLSIAPETLGSQLPLQLAPQDIDVPLEFPLGQFQGAYAGNGFNLIFRPLPKDDKTFFKIPPVKPTNLPDDNTLELNLTKEQLTFGRTIGEIPNRGFVDNKQVDITLGGLPYLQTVQDVSNPATGKGDRADPKSIHFEPGMWLHVPASDNPSNSATVVRMASIPHGTTINAQGRSPAKAATVLGGTGGGPKFEVADTRPFLISDGTKFTFPSMDAKLGNTRRIPQNLEPYSKASTITTEIIANPNLVLQRAITGQEIRETIAFEVTTGGPTESLNGGGISNISFLAGTQDSVPVSIPQKPQPQSASPNALAPLMKSRFWIETVMYDVDVPALTDARIPTPLRPVMPKDSTAPTPEFAVLPPLGKLPSAPRRIKIPGIQIQYSQTVLLNFGKLSWPHVSVATLVPKNPQPFRMT